MSEIQHKKRQNANIRREKTRHAPFLRKEDREPVEVSTQASRQQETEANSPVDKDQEHKPKDPNPRPPRLNETLIRPLHTLHLRRAQESEIDYTTASPADETRRIRQTDEPVKHDARPGTNRQIRQRREARTRNETVVRQPVAVTRLEDARRVPADRQRIKRARRHVQVAIPRGPSAGQDDGVDDAVQHGDTGVLDADDERGTARAGAAVGEARVVGGADEADGQRAQDVEEDQAREVAARGAGDIVAGGFEFAGGYDDEFGGEEKGEC